MKYHDKNNRPIVKDHRSGVVSNDGNGMVGGRWENTTILAYKDCYLCDIMDGIVEEEKSDDVFAWLKDRLGDPIRFEAYFDMGYDDSVGLGYYYDLDESFLPEDTEDAIDQCPLLNDEEKKSIVSKMQDIADDSNSYEFYEVDCEEE